MNLKRRNNEPVTIQFLMSTLIRGGFVADGRGGKPRLADVLVDGDSIVAVGMGLRGDTVV